MTVAVRGTVASNQVGTEGEIMRQAGIAYLQRMAGYVPAQMDAKILMYPPINSQDATASDVMMSRLCASDIRNSNPRTPFLLTVWMLVGFNNPYQIFAWSNDKELTLQVASLLLRIACGDTPATQERKDLIRAVTFAKLAAITPAIWKLRAQYGAENESRRVAAHQSDVIATAVLRAIGIARTYDATSEWLAWSLSDIVHELAQIHGTTVSAYIRKKAQSWCYVNDAEAGKITRELLFDILLLGGRLEVEAET